MKKAIGIVVLIVFLVAVYFAVDNVFKNAGVSMRGNVVTKVSAIICTGVIFVFAVISKLISNNVIAQIQKTQDPDEKIRKLEKFMKSNAKVNDTDLEKAKDRDSINETLKLKIMLSNYIATAYMSKDEYDRALEVYKNIWGLFDYLRDPIQENGLNTKDICLLNIINCYCNIRKLKKAEDLMQQFIQREDRGLISRYSIGITHLYLEITKKDALKARSLYNKYKIDSEKMAEKHKDNNIIYEYMLCDALIDKLEHNLSAARNKLKQICENSTNYGDRRRAQEELEKIATF